MGMQVKLSATIMTLNNERDLALCIESLLPLADEILVVDSFSTDKTELICARYDKVRFVQNTWCGFIGQRNWASNEAKYDHIIAMDADEALSEELQNSILAVKENWNGEGYYFNRLNQLCGKWMKHGRWYPDKKMRLYDRKTVKTVGTEPHGYFIAADGSMGSFLKGDLLHYCYPTLAEFVEKNNSYTTWFAEDAYKKGKKISIFEMILKTKWRFFRDYFLKMGFRNGYLGLVSTVIESANVFIKYAKLKDEYKKYE
ncbi:MAG: glycosyltransferase family 2 protein [Marinifilaceae bacterium]